MNDHSGRVSISDPSDAHSFRYDVVTLGEGLLRYTPPSLRRIEQATIFEVEVGGSEVNVAVGLARLGLRCAWVSRMTDNALGRLIQRQLAANGVDTSHVRWTSDDRVGIYYLEEGRPPRSSTVIYDRAGSAMSKMRPEDLSQDLFSSGAARWLHVTGITPAISHDAAATISRAMESAHRVGWGVSFDFNLRTRLWSADEAARRCEPLIRMCDVFVISRKDAAVAYGITEESPEVLARTLGAKYPDKTVVVTLSKDGAAGIDRTGNFIYQPAFPAEQVGRIGGGDAFAAGFLSQFIMADSPDRLTRSLRWGAAAAALKYSIPGDMPLIDRADVERLANSDAGLARDLMR